MNINMNFKAGVLLITAITGSVTTNAFALDTANQGYLIKAFKALDTDGSNSLSAAEAKKETLFAKNFKAADVNSDGLLDEEEYANYRSQAEQKTMKRVANDSYLTSKVKANLLKEEGIKSVKISVETHQGTVLLSGFVENEAQINLAEKVAAETEGVQSVKNSLMLRKD